MLLEMRALTSASRGIAMMASAAIDISSHSNDPLALPHDEELAAFHASHLLPQAYAHLEVVLAGGDAVAAFGVEAF